ncbi:MAG: peroxin [Alectoria sarmentosa]|nr:MAG: peroxin [Alectoria sarmentosa]
MSATRRWLRRNRTGFAIGFGLIGVGYVAGQYVLSKITEARERLAGDRIAKENLRRRFQHNQEDCTITVLELLPTVAENIIEALPSEKITQHLQQKKAERLGKSAGTSDVAPSELSSGTPSAADEDGRSLSSFQSEGYVHASQMGAPSFGNGKSKSPSSKAQLWNDLKISSITRSFTLLYTVTLLSLLTRTQLNLLGRRNYLSSVVSLASHPQHDPTISLEDHDDDNVERVYGNDFDTNRKYLTFSWWLLHRGWKEVMVKVEDAVKEVFGSVNPREDIPLERISSLILEVRKAVEGATPEERKTRKWLPFLLPPSDQEESVLQESGMTTPPNLPSPPTSPASSTMSSPLRRLLDETSDLIDSPMFTHVLTLLLDATFSQLVDKKLRSEAYKLACLSPTATSEPRIAEVTDSDPLTASAKLATILAVMTREAHKIGNGVPNEYVQAMEAVSELDAFAAVVYSSNFEFEAGVETNITPDSTVFGGRDEIAGGGKDGKSLGSRSTAEVEDVVRVGIGGGIIDRANGAVDAAWGGFESVWGKVTGSGESAMTG